MLLENLYFCLGFERKFIFWIILYFFVKLYVDVLFSFYVLRDKNVMFINCIVDFKIYD